MAAVNSQDVRCDGRAYLRVSIDRSGRKRSNVEQDDDNRRAWAGWSWGEPYEDATSASRYARKARDDWPRLIGDVRDGRFGARHLVLWESSRGSRQVGEWVELIDLCEARGVKIAVTEHERIYDPANPRDRKDLIDGANDAEYESAKTSRRVLRAAVAQARAGKPSGRIPFGYGRTRDPRTGRFAEQVIDDTEAPLIAELFKRISAGHSLHGIARDWKARGVVTRARHNADGTVTPGHPFSMQHLRSLATNPLFMGKKVYVPGRRGGTTTSRDLRREDAIVTDAAWPAIVSERGWWAVQAILEDPKRSTHRPGRGSHLLGMIAVCGVCGESLKVAFPRGRRIYKCQTGGCVSVGADDLDAYAEDAILGYLSRPDNVARLVADDGGDAALEAARTEAARVQAELDDLADQVGRGDLSPALAGRAEPQMLARLREAEARVAELATPSKLRGLIEPGKNVRKHWKAAPMSAKRTLARMLLTPDFLGTLAVTTTPIRGRRAPIGDRVVWHTEDRDAA